jgi:hypothetical protein
MRPATWQKQKQADFGAEPFVGLFFCYKGMRKFDAKSWRLQSLLT